MPEILFPYRFRTYNGPNNKVTEEGKEIRFVVFRRVCVGTRAFSRDLRTRAIVPRAV